MRFSKEERTMWLDDWKQSGKSAWTYAKENGLIPQTFCGWVKRAKKSITGFVEIPEYKKPTPKEPQVIVVEKGDVKIHIPLSVWAEGASTIMEGLKAVL